MWRGHGLFRLLHVLSISMSVDAVARALHQALKATKETENCQIVDLFMAAFRPPGVARLGTSVQKRSDKVGFAAYVPKHI